jgi:hypothetical protein
MLSVVMLNVLMLSVVVSFYLGIGEVSQVVIRGQCYKTFNGRPLRLSIISWRVCVKRL